MSAVISAPMRTIDLGQKASEYDSFYTDSERELKRKARETRS
jgi:hypothetical protein